jgi:uncharacterized membrane protein YphA (DoxX/SURF4 family)
MQSSESSSSLTNSELQQKTSLPPSITRSKGVAIWALRVLVGGVFVVSGLTKSVDLWGFVFKLEEYLAVWHITQPRTIVLMFALLLSAYEFVLGLLLAMGCYKRVAPIGLSLTMIVMLPLTLYLWIADPVSDCGCFGDFVHISNAATFWKNVALTAALAYLVKNNAKQTQTLFTPAIQWIVGACISLYILIVALYGYNAQPMLDFRSYPVGTSLLSEDDDADIDYVLIYEKDGNRQEFSIDNLPDSTWQFVDRIENSKNGGGATKLQNSIAIFDGDENVTSDVITPSGKQLLLVIPDPQRAGVEFTYTINEIKEYADSIGTPMIALLGTNQRGVERWKDIAMADYDCFTVDATQLKELSRGNISIVMLDNGVITSKTTVSSLDPDEVENSASTDDFFDELEGNGFEWFVVLNCVFGGGLLLLYLCQRIILHMRTKIQRAYRKKHAKNE